ncbi:MFS general substrate transporter [Ganoderma sinense ZZ0214-1]|uniref:MFS general substrate transporter n=1 Tax=Ganoderma sinense ZZ0214-1 TaxID=1077348 RepID=A0A2G8SUC5_9APHY|nr:MFS general substrate transporter [Ganoderma sinense ZZ0214-1]
MTADIRLVGLPSVLLSVPVQEEHLGSVIYHESLLTEDTHVQQQASVSGAATHEILQPDAHLTLRPPISRLATDGMLQEDEARDEKDSASISAAPHPAVGLAYPPTLLAQAPPESVLESKGLRRLQMASSFLTLLLAGWNGGATGALLPYIERAHHFGYAQVSVLFVCTFLGYVVSAATTGTLTRRVGYGHTMLISVMIELAGNIINSSQQANFGLMCFGFFVVGLAFATQLGLCNAYFATLDKPLMWTGILHGIYGLGAFASPLLATAMVTRGVPYHLFYTTNIGMNIPVFALAWVAFRNLHALPRHPNERPIEEGSAAPSFGTTLRSRAVWTLAIFLMLYVGAEESIGGWIVSYILEVRTGSPEGASWVASSFYLGLALGRIFLPPLNVLLGERRSVIVYLCFAIGLECLAWFLPYLASTAVCTALVGVAISTFYAAAITTGGKLVPRTMHADAFALMSAVGQSGSAFWPLMVGIMSTRKGIWVVEPTVVALLGAQGICWLLVPKAGRRSE